MNLACLRPTFSLHSLKIIHGLAKESYLKKNLIANWIPGRRDCVNPFSYSNSYHSTYHSCMFSSSSKMSAVASSSKDNNVESSNNYRPFALEGEALESDWVKELDLEKAKAFLSQDDSPPKILILYGSLRKRSYSRFLAYEFARVLELLGAEVRVFDPKGLPMKDDESDTHPKVLELRSLSIWSEAQVWCCPEQHGTITGVFKTQIDWIPLELGSVRPSQGRTLAVAQVNGGSQSFNVVNTLRILGRWMRMFTIPNQSSIPKAWLEFDPAGRLKPSSYRNRVVDVAEELFKVTLLTRPHSDFLVDRYSEREEKKKEGRLLSQAEKELKKQKA